MTRPRHTLVDLDTTSYYHCICRCVRRAFLWGEDHLTGKDYRHRKAWVVDRLAVLDNVFAIDVAAYAVMSNHYHVVLRINCDQARNWRETEVIDRWTKLFNLPLLVQRYQDGLATAPEAHAAKDIIEQWRDRLMNLSWYMRTLNEYLARKANEEDDCKGRFWEGRFKSQALLDEAAVLTAMTYVDLNPIRAGITDLPETSDFTSVQQRIHQLQSQAQKENAQPTLMQLTSRQHSSHPQALRFDENEYLKLLDWSGRAVRADKRGAIPEDVLPILQRLHINSDRFLQYLRKDASYSITRYCASGHASKLLAYAKNTGRKFIRGWRQQQALYLR